MSNFKPFFISVIALLMAGCQGFSTISEDDSSAGTPQNVKSFGTCDRKAVSLINLCTEVVGTDYNDIDYLGVLQTNCEATGGVFSTANCDRTGSIGTCIVEKNRPNEAHTTFYPPQYTEASAEMDCTTNGGKFHRN